MYVYKRGMLQNVVLLSKPFDPFGQYIIPPPTEVDQNPDGRKERVQFDKITARVSRLCYGLDPEHVDPAAITQKVISGVYQGVTTVELDNLVSRVYLALLIKLTENPKGCRDSCLHDCHSSRLCHPRRTHCRLKSAQADEEAIFRRDSGSVRLCEPEEQPTMPNDLEGDIRGCDEAC